MSGRKKIYRHKYIYINGKLHLSLTTHTQNLENTTNVIYLKTQEFLLKSCVYKLMHIHKLIHLVETYSHLKAVKKLQF